MVQRVCCLVNLRSTQCQSQLMCRSERLWKPAGISRKSGHFLKVFQWNVLADVLAQHGDFVRVPQQALTWPFRRQLILQEILKPQADIICLQEVNKYDEFFLSTLKQHGYDGAFFCKPCSPAEQYGASCDGCALFYRADRFSICNAAQDRSLPSSHLQYYVGADSPSMILCVALQLGQTYTSCNGEGGNQGMLRTCLLDNASGTLLYVANTHLKAKAGSKNDAIQDHQAVQKGVQSMSTAALTAARTSLDTKQSTQQTPLIILCGDLNTTPDSSTCQLVGNHALSLKSCWDTSPSTDAASNNAPSRQLFRPGSSDLMASQRVSLTTSGTQWINALS